MRMAAASRMLPASASTKNHPATSSLRRQGPIQPSALLSSLGVLATRIGEIKSIQQLIIQIPPLRILFLNQSDLPRAFPLLDLLLTSDSVADVAMPLLIHQAMDLILPGESFYQIVLMLPHASRHVMGDAGVERAVSSAGEDVDVSCFGHGVANLKALDGSLPSQG